MGGCGTITAPHPQQQRRAVWGAIMNDSDTIHCRITTQPKHDLRGFRDYSLPIMPLIGDLVMLMWEYTPKGIFRVVDRMINQTNVYLWVELVEE